MTMKWRIFRKTTILTKSVIGIVTKLIPTAKSMNITRIGKNTSARGISIETLTDASTAVERIITTITGANISILTTKRTVKDISKYINIIEISYIYD